MGFRYRKSIRLAPGLRINLSKSGPSLSVGRRGATVNFGPKGTKLTVGIPGTGLSYQTKLGPSTRKRRSTPETYANIEPPPLKFHESPRLRASTGPGRIGWAVAAGAVVVIGLFVQGASGPRASSEHVAVTVADALTPPAAASEKTAERDMVEISAAANIREAPRLDAGVIGVAARHDKFGVFGRSGAWTQIGKDAAIGWVGNSRLTPSER